MTERHERAVIVCSGPSAELGEWQDYLPRFIADGGVVIAVNASIEFLLHVTHWVTIDPSARNRRLMNMRRRGVRYYAAVPPDYGQPKAKWRCHRQPPERGLQYLRRSKRPLLSLDSGELATGNSGFGALNLALHFGCRKVAFVGLDANSNGYAHTHRRLRPYRMGHLPHLFKSAVTLLGSRGCEVVNGSRFSRVTCFERMDANSALEWVSHV